MLCPTPAFWQPRPCLSKPLLKQAPDAVSRSRLLAASMKESGASLELHMDNKNVLCHSWPSPRLHSFDTPTPVTTVVCRLMALPCTSSAADGVRAVTNIMLLSTTLSIVQCLQPCHLFQPSRLEPTGVSHSLEEWWDSTCLDTFVSSHLPSATREAGAVAEQAGEVCSFQPMPQLHTSGHRDGRPFWARDLLILKRTGLPSQTGHRGRQVVLLPAAMPVCRSAMGKCRCSHGNNGGHHLPL